MTDNIANKVFGGATLMIALRLAVKFIGLFSTMILARLLVPTDFGLIAIAMTIYALLELIYSFGFDMALIQNQKADDDDYNSAWTIQIIFGGIAALLMVGLAIPVSQYYEDPRLQQIMWVLASGFVLQSFKNIGVVNFRKDFKFKTEFKFQIITKILSTSITLSLAFMLRSYWALIAGMVASNVFNLILSYIMSSYRPRFCLKKWHGVVKFSKWLLINNLLFFFNSRIQDLIIGKLLSPQAVGVITVSREVADLTTTELIAPINRATYPGYTKVAHDKTALSQLFTNIIASIALLAIPAGLGVSVLAPILVPLMLGEQWQEAVIFIQILAITSITAALNTNNGYVYMALNKPRITTVLFTFRLAVYLPALYWFLQEFGLIGAAYTAVLITSIMFPLGVYIACYQMNLSMLSYLTNLIRPVASGVLMYWVLNQLVTIEADYFNMPLLKLTMYSLGYAVLGAAIYFASLYLLWFAGGKKNTAEKKLFNKINLFFTRKLAPHISKE